MKCDELLKNLSEYIDGGLELPECSDFEKHLAGCSPCRVVVDNIRQTITLYKGNDPYPMPDDFRLRLRQSLKTSWDKKFT